MSKKRRGAPPVDKLAQAKEIEVAVWIEAEISLALQTIEARRQAAETFEQATDRSWAAAGGTETRAERLKISERELRIKAKAEQRLRVLRKLQEIVGASRALEAVAAEQLDGSSWAETLAWVDEQLGAARGMIEEQERKGGGDRLAVRRASILRSLRDLVVQKSRSEADELGELLRGLDRAADPEGSLLRALRSSSGETGISLGAAQVETILQAIRAQRKRSKQRSIPAILATICVEWLDAQAKTTTSKKGARS